MAKTVKKSKKADAKDKKPFLSAVKKKLALLAASPMAVVAVVFILAGSTSAVGIVYHVVTQNEAKAPVEEKVEEVELPDISPAPTEDVEDEDTEHGPPVVKEDGNDEYLVWRNCVDDINVVTGEKCKVGNYSGADEKRDEARRNSYDAIRTYLNARGWPEAQITGSEGNWYITATKTVAQGTFNCPGSTMKGNEDQLARYYDYTFGTLMPPSVKGRHVVINIPTPDGTITMTIREDKTHNISQMDYSGIVFEAGEEREHYQFGLCN